MHPQTLARLLPAAALTLMLIGGTLALDGPPATEPAAAFPEVQAVEPTEPADEAPDVDLMELGAPLEALPASAASVYPALPCPFAAGDPRCEKALAHLRVEMDRGHGADLSRPDLLPLLTPPDVTQGFGPTGLWNEPLEMVDGQPVHYHDGIDFAADEGDPVVAAGSGKVVFADVIPSGAQTVEIAHPGGYHSLYLHASQLLVTAGQDVVKGQIIALVGSTGMSSGPHLHFTVQDPSGKAISPAPFVGPLPEVDNFALDPPYVPPAPVYVPAPVFRPRFVPAPARPAPAVRPAPRPVAPARPAAAAPIRRR